MISKVDLHMHTQASDGTDSIPILLKKIQELGIKTFAITDHDTIRGAMEMKKLVPERIDYICGIEISCITEVAKCHILAYNYDLSNEAFKALVEETEEVRTDKLMRRLKFFREEYGIIFSDEEVNWLHSLPSAGKPHFAKLLAERGLAADIKSAIKIYFNHAPSGRIEAERAIKALKKAGAVVIWAHPYGGTSEKRLTKEQFTKQLDTLIRAGIDGLECYYSEFSQSEIEALCNIANEKGLLISGGSDYHGTVKPWIHIGMLNKEDKRIAEEQLTVLQAF